MQSGARDRVLVNANYHREVATAFLNRLPEDRIDAIEKTAKEEPAKEEPRRMRAVRAAAPGEEAPAEVPVAEAAPPAPEEEPTEDEKKYRMHIEAAMQLEAIAAAASAPATTTVAQERDSINVTRGQAGMVRRGNLRRGNN